MISRSAAFRLTIGSFAAIAALIFGLLFFFVVPAPSKRTAIEVSGILVSMSRPHPDDGDIGIVLDNGQRYYINRVDEISYLDWEKMLAEVQPGMEIHLTVVKPLAWRLLAKDTTTSLPVAGLRTADTVYMDTGIAAVTWDSQSKYCVIAITSFIVCLICLLPDLFRLLDRRSLAKI